MKDSRYVVHHARRCERIPPFGLVAQGRGINEWLEHRAWLSRDQRVIELAGAIVASAHDSFHLARVHIPGDQGYLGDNRIGNAGA
jgi:hypothetical protein